MSDRLQIPAAVRAAFLLAGALLAVGIPVSHAQKTGRVEGKVLDEQGNPIGGIELTLVPTGNATAQPRRLKVGKDGTFHHAFCPYGTYKVELLGANLFIRSMTYVLKDDTGLELMREARDAHPVQGLPAFKVGLGQQVELTVVTASKKVQEKLAQDLALAEASGSLKEAAEAYEAGDMSRVLELTDKLLLEKPDLGRALYLRGVAMTRLERFDEATAALRKAIEKEPEQPGVDGALGVALVQRGEALVKSGQRDEAKPLFGEALGRLDHELRSSQGSVPLMTSQAIALEELGQLEPLTAVLEKLMAADPANATIRHRLAEIHARAGQGDKSLEILKEGPRPDAKSAEILYNLAAQRFNDGDVEGSISAASMGLEFNPDLYLLHRVLGRAYASKGETQRAVAALEKAIPLAPTADAERAADEELLKALRRKGS